MRALGITWTTESLGKYLTDPQAMVPATYMAFTGLKRNDDRSALICFLNGLTGGAP
jgi:cytochrome c